MNTGPGPQLVRAESSRLLLARDDSWPVTPAHRVAAYAALVCVKSINTTFSASDAYSGFLDIGNVKCIIACIRLVQNGKICFDKHCPVLTLFATCHWRVIPRPGALGLM